MLQDINIFFASLVDRCENESHVMCHDCFIGSGTFDSSHIHFRLALVFAFQVMIQLNVA